MSQIVNMVVSQKTDNAKLSIEFSAPLRELSKSKVLGTLLNEVFEFQKVACKHRTSRFMTNEITDIKLTIGEYSFDSEQIDKGDNQILKIFRAKMKLRNTPQGRKHFATLVNDLITYMCREQYEITFEELIDSLDELILTNQLVKDFEAIALN